MSFKAFAPITTHPTDPKRLPKDLRESLPAEAREKKRLYSKDLPTELLDWVPRIREVAKQAREVHLLMNNCYGDKAVNNAAELGELLFPAA